MRNSDVAMAVATVILAFVAILQWRTLEKTDQTLRAGNRAFVYFERPGVDPDRTPSGETTYAIFVPVINNGATPTQHLLVLADCAIAPSADISEPFLLPRVRNNEFRSLNLGPKQNAVALACYLNPSEFAAVQGRQMSLFLLGEAKYTDIYTEPHITRIAHQMFIDVNHKYSSQPAGKHNCSDDGCRLVEK